MTVVFQTSEEVPRRAMGAWARGCLLGAVGGLLLLVLVTGADALSRGDGYDLTRHWISLLQHGDHGWLATGAFAVTGLLVLASAPAVRSAQPATSSRQVAAIPVLVASLGVALVVLAGYPIDPSMEYPVRADAYVVTTTGQIHSVAGAVVLGSSAALCWCIAAAADRRLGTAAWVPTAARSSAAAIVAIFILCSTAVVLSEAGSWEAARAGAFQRIALLLGGVWLGWYALALATGSPTTDVDGR